MYGSNGIGYVLNGSSRGLPSNLSSRNVTLSSPSGVRDDDLVDTSCDSPLLFDNVGEPREC